MDQQIMNKLKVAALPQNKVIKLSHNQRRRAIVVQSKRTKINLMQMTGHQ
jgi:hypothetical protein